MTRRPLEVPRARGAALIHAILFTALFCAVVATVAGSCLAGIHAVRSRTDRIQALYAAESGIAVGIASLAAESDADRVVEGTVGRGTYRVSSRSTSSGVEFRAVGTCGDARRTVVVHGTIGIGGFVRTQWSAF